MQNNLTYYNYKNLAYMAVDIETKDPNLKDLGPGVYRKDGYILGVAFADKDFGEYYPINHNDTTPAERQRNLVYIKDQLGTRNKKIFANGMYDLDWLVNFENIDVKGTFEDVQIAEPLIDEYRPTYSLDFLASHYLGKHKATDAIVEYCNKKGWKTTKSSKGREHLWKMPGSLVAPYAAEDALLTYKVLFEQYKILAEQDLINIYNLEMKLFPVLLKMRKNGVRIDTERLKKLGEELEQEREKLQRKLNGQAGFKINVGSKLDMTTLFNKLDLPIEYKETTKKMQEKGIKQGNPTFDKQALIKCKHPIAKEVLTLKHTQTLLNLFIKKYPGFLVGDRIHCGFHQLRSDNYGARPGRLSSSRPNLQQVSSNDESDFYNSDLLNGQALRKIFLPEIDHDWLSLDWSQVEYRVIAHYARGEGAEQIRTKYNNDPTTDYHNEIGVMTGIGTDKKARKKVKGLNFGSAYKMGAETMAVTNGWPLEFAKEILKLYHEKVPFVRYTSNLVSSKVKRTGFIKTLLGRRSRLVDPNKAYKFFNSLIQGTAADIMKKSMVDANEAGILESLTWHMTVHDEIDASMPRTKEGHEAGKELKHIMENCVKLRVPILADAEIGPNWGELKEWRFT